MPLDLAALKKVPWWGWAVGGGAVLGVGFFIVKGRPSSASSTQPSNATAANIPDGLNAADLAGLPFDYQDYDAQYTDTDASQSADNTTPPPPASPPSPGTQYEPGNEPSQKQHTPPPPPSSKQDETPLTVQPWPAWDSTLSGIGQHYGMSWQQLYTFDNNKATIDELAHEHGHYGDEYNWLFPGEIVEVPAHP